MHGDKASTFYAQSKGQWKSIREIYLREELIVVPCTFAKNTIKITYHTLGINSAVCIRLFAMERATRITKGVSPSDILARMHYTDESLHQKSAHS